MDAQGVPAGAGGDRSAERDLRQAAARAHPLAGPRERDVGPGDGCAARAPVRLEHVAVEVDRVPAERREAHHASHAAPDQALALDRAAVRAPAVRVALLALAG